MNNLLSEYNKARNKIISELKNKHGIINSGCNIKFRYNKKIVNTGIILGVHANRDSVRIYNPKTNKKYFIDLYQIIEVF